MESPQLKFSFVQVSYNPKPEWHEASLKSAEGLFDEYILVDDGSTPPLEKSTFRHEVNKGIKEARNAAVALAKGEWIASLDDDDEFIRENVEKLKEIALTSDADILSFPCQLFGKVTGLWGTYPIMKDIVKDNQIPSNCWIRKSAWEKIGGYQYEKAEDWDFWARAFKKGLKFQHSLFPVYKHRMRSDSVSGNWEGKVLDDIRKEIQERYDRS